MEKKIIISEEDRDFIQRLDIEMSSRQNLISFMLSNDMNIDTEQFKQYQKEYNQYFFDFDKAKREIIENKYIANEIEDYKNKKINWNLEYFTRVLTIEEG